MAVLLQSIIAGIWMFALITQTRRLLRLARVEQLRNWAEPSRSRIRTGLNRIWWWLGQDEFWNGVQLDGLRCIELTLMIFLCASCSRAMAWRQPCIWRTSSIVIRRECYWSRRALWPMRRCKQPLLPERCIKAMFVFVLVSLLMRNSSCAAVMGDQRVDGGR